MGWRQRAAWSWASGRKASSPALEAIYKAYPLMRTLALLPRDYLTLPDDIPRLTQDVYDPDLALPEEPEGYGEAREEWNRLIARQEGRATAYLIKAPQSDDILNDWLSHTPKEAAGRPRCVIQGTVWRCW